MTEQVQPGDILLTRNKGDDETVNTSPGYFNHAAIFSVKNWVVESQATPNCVIAVPVWNFFDRYPEILVMRPLDHRVAHHAAYIATKYVGMPYKKLMSFRPLWRWKNGDNCVSLLRRILNVVTGKDYRWRIPDYVVVDDDFKAVAHKKDYENHVDVQNFLLGMTQVWTGQDAYYVR